jgi:Protein of unknown function (DUF2809)
VLVALGTIGLGVAVYLVADRLPPTVGDVLGDALYAAMIACWAGAAAPRAAVWRRGVAAWGLCAGIEASQLVREPRLDALRGTSLGHLVLGSDFDARDLASYAAGVAAVLLLERMWRRSASSSGPDR